MNVDKAEFVKFAQKMESISERTDERVKDMGEKVDKIYKITVEGNGDSLVTRITIAEHNLKTFLEKQKEIEEKTDKNTTTRERLAGAGIALSIIVTGINLYLVLAA
jgi:hypothetical protein